jgi:hypothetical protein
MNSADFFVCYFFVKSEKNLTPGSILFVQVILYFVCCCFFINLMV